MNIMTAPARETAQKLGQGPDAADFDFRMTDLEERLSAPDGAQVKEELLARLSEKEQQLKTALRVGLAPQDYEKAKVAHRGFLAAIDIIRRYPVK